MSDDPNFIPARPRQPGDTPIPPAPMISKDDIWRRATDDEAVSAFDIENFVFDLVASSSVENQSIGALARLALDRAQEEAAPLIAQLIKSRREDSSRSD
jgi:hypothetical protein